MIFPELGKSNATNRSQPAKGAYPQGGSVMGMVYGVGAETPMAAGIEDLGRFHLHLLSSVGRDPLNDFTRLSHYSVK
jgi:hypothetical protein